VPLTVYLVLNQFGEEIIQIGGSSSHM